MNEFFKAGEKGESLETLGDLMTASHDSLRDLYDCSHPDLDRLVTIGNEFRYGARLTGAGYESHRCVSAIIIDIFLILGGVAVPLR